MALSLTNYKGILLLVLVMSISFTACEDYVQFENPVPNKGELTQIPVEYHGIYNSVEQPSDRYQICDEGIFKIRIISFPQPLDFHKNTPVCKEKQNDFYIPEGNDCIQIDFTNFPDSIRTRLFELDTLFGIGNSYSLRKDTDKLFLNYRQEGYYSLKILQKEPSGNLSLISVDIEDLINRNGLISKNINYLHPDNDLLLFIIEPNDEELNNLLNYGYQNKELTLVPLILF